MARLGERVQKKRDQVVERKAQIEALAEVTAQHRRGFTRAVESSRLHGKGSGLEEGAGKGVQQINPGFLILIFRAKIGHF